MSPRAYSSSIRDAHLEQTRALLIDRARALLVEGGLTALTLPKLAQAAGVSAPTVYRHFPTLDDLFRALLEWLRPRLGLEPERLLGATPAQLPEMPLENYPRYEAEAALLRPLIDSGEFNRVRAASMHERARKAGERLRAHAPGWPSRELEARLGAVWALNAPQVWRWLRDTWGLDNDEAARAASWAMGTLVAALAQGPEAAKAPSASAPRARKKQKKK